MESAFSFPFGGENDFKQNQDDCRKWVFHQFLIS